MPTTEFHCRRCERVFRKLFFRGEEPGSVPCPFCGNTAATKSPKAEPLFDGISESSPLAKDTN